MLDFSRERIVWDVVVQKREWSPTLGDKGGLAGRAFEDTLAKSIGVHQGAGRQGSCGQSVRSAAAQESQRPAGWAQRGLMATSWSGWGSVLACHLSSSRNPGPLKREGGGQDGLCDSLGQSPHHGPGAGALGGTLDSRP